MVVSEDYVYKVPDVPWKVNPVLTILPVCPTMDMSEVATFCTALSLYSFPFFRGLRETGKRNCTYLLLL